MLRERRTGARRPVRMEVVVDDERRFRCAATVDLSRAGALIEADEPADIGSEVKLIPLLETKTPIFEIPAIVVRVDRAPGSRRYRMAMALRLRDGEAEAIDEIVGRRA